MRSIVYVLLWPFTRKGAYGFHKKAWIFFTVTVREFEFSQREVKVSRRVHSVLQNFLSWRETSHAVNDQWKLSRREIKSENFHPVRLIGREETSRHEI